jgi:hypothetical protein
MTRARRRPLSRIAFWSVNIGLVGLVYVALVEPVAAWFSSRNAEIADKTELLSRYERALASPRAGTELADPAGVFLLGSTDAVRSAAMQEAVRRIAAASGVRILSVSDMPLARERGGIVALRVDMAGPLKAVSQTIAGLERSTPMLAIARTGIRASATREETAGDLTPLDVQLDIVGFAAR